VEVSSLNVETVGRITQRRGTGLAEIDDDVEDHYVALERRLRRSGV
jgi:hypothetical protein